jgi:hypothetical protein
VVKGDEEVSFYSSQDEAFIGGAMEMAADGMFGGGGGGWAWSFTDALRRYNGGNLTEDMVGEFYAITWGTQASNVSATAVEGGFNVGYTATLTGKTYQGDFVSTERILNYFQTLADLYGSDKPSYLSNWNNEDKRPWNDIRTGISVGGAFLETMNQGVRGGNRVINILSGTKGFTPYVQGVSKVLKPLGTGVGVISLGATVVNAFTDPNGPQIHHLIDAAADIGSIICPVFGLIWFAGDLISQGVSGKSLSENIQGLIKK